MSHQISNYAFRQTMLGAARVQLRVICALVLRETRTRFGHSRLGYAWALVEPIASVIVLSLVYLTMGRHTPVGTSLELFFITGFMPYMIYDKTAKRVGGSISANKALLNLPIVKNVDVILGRAILELGTELTIMLILLGTLFAFGVSEAVPRDPLRLANAVLVAWLLGVGIGSINAVINALFKSWDNIFNILTRPLYLLSGIFFVPERVPPPLKDWFLLNPVLHAVEWFRSSFYEDYGKFSLDTRYLLTWVFATLIIGFALERKMRRKLFVGG